MGNEFIFTYKSTAKGSHGVTFSQALASGLAPDGGLFVPERWPQLDGGLHWLEAGPVALAEAILGAFMEGDALADQVPAIAREVYDIPLPVSPLADGHLLLELFHGPTAAFKDFGARFLAQCLSRSERRLRILVATSGDTGGAVAAACHDQPGLEVVVLYPKGGVSPLQELQLTCWGESVQALAVRGSFDHCQSLVKQALAHNPWPGVALTTANSINIGRLVPQVVHHAWGALHGLAAHGEPLDFRLQSLV